MQIHTHTDSTIEGREALAVHVTEVVERALNRSSEHITRVEVHLSDESGGKQDFMAEAQIFVHGLGFR